MAAPGLGGDAVGQPGIWSLAVIKHFHVFGHGHPGPSSGGKDPLVIHFLFQTSEKRLGYGILPTPSGASHRLNDTGLGAVGRECCRGVVGSGVAVNQSVTGDPAMRPDHGHGVDDQTAAHMLRQLPADDHTDGQSDNRGQIQPALASAQIRNI